MPDFKPLPLTSAEKAIATQFEAFSATLSKSTHPLDPRKTAFSVFYRDEDTDEPLGAFATDDWDLILTMLHLCQAKRQVH